MSNSTTHELPTEISALVADDLLSDFAFVSCANLNVVSRLVHCGTLPALLHTVDWIPKLDALITKWGALEIVELLGFCASALSFSRLACLLSPRLLASPQLDARAQQMCTSCAHLVRIYVCTSCSYVCTT
jgi:hypothetical protein